MKKALCLILVLVCLGTMAVAESVPSRSTADLVETVEIRTESGAAAEDLIIATVEDEVAYATEIEVCQNEIARLQESASVAEYFGEVRNSSGEVVSLTEVLGSEQLVVNEFMPIIVDNYDATYGNVTVVFKFSTPYEKDEPVVVLIGIVNPETGLVEWVALEGVGTGVDGAIEVEFTAEFLEAIQSGSAMMAIVNK